MMRWRRKKSPSPSLSLSPSQSSSSSSILHLSWFSKIKKSRKNFECDPEKGEIDVGCRGSQMPMSWKNGKLYGGDDGSDWRLSFREENYEVGRGRMGLKAVWYDPENENQEFSFPNCQSYRTDDVAKREEALKFNQMVSNIRKLRKLPNCEGEKGRENRELRGMRKKSKKLDFEKQSNFVLQEKDIFETKPVKLSLATKERNQKKEALSSNSIFKTTEEDYNLEALSLDEERVSLKEVKLKESKAKSENQRKSLYISTKHNSKVGAFSPRTAYKMECKIKAIENMKRAKRKTDKKLREKPARERTAFDSFAVVKSSFDPQSDFKKSMIEMITVRGITKAAELEELLACYLTLNADVYHETIIKVFRQVWFELIQDHLAPAI